MAKAKPKNNAALASALKKFLGTKASATGKKGTLPFDEATIDKNYREPSTLGALGSASKDMLADLKMWWDTGNFGEPEQGSKNKEKEKQDTERTKKLAATIGAVKATPKESKQNLKELLAINLQSQNLLDKILNEIVILRKVTEGSLKFEKTGRGSAYRDMVSGKYTKVKSSIDKDKTRPIASARRSAAITAANPASPVLASLATSKNVQFTSSAELKAPAPQEAAESSSGFMGSVMDYLPGLGANKPTPTVAGTAGTVAKTSMLSRAANFMGGKGGFIGAGITGAIGGGLYAYDKFNQASNEKQADVMAAQEQLRAGQISQTEYNNLVQEADKKSAITKGEGIGGGVGRFGGALAGAKLGASFGTFFGPAGTVVGGLAGGALGYMAGGSIGEAVGNIGGRISNLFGSNKNSQTVTVNSSGNFRTDIGNGQIISGEYKDGKYYINGTQVSEQEYKTIKESANKAFDKNGLEAREKTQGLSSSLKDDTSGLIQPAGTSDLGSRINALSRANNELMQGLQAANNTTIINNNNSSGSGQSGVIALKPGVRPDYSSLTRYLDKVAVY